MENFTLLAILFGVVIGYAMNHFYSKSTKIHKKTYQKIQDLSNIQISENSFLKKELERLENNVNLLQIQSDKYRELSSTKQSNIASLETTIDGNNKIIEQLNFHITQNNNQITNLNQTIDSLKEEKNLSQSNLENTEKNVNRCIYENSILKEDINKTNEIVLQLKQANATLNAENKYLKQKLEEQKAEIEEIGKKFAKEFQLLADEILETKSKKFTEINQQNLKLILDPLGKNIDEFKKTVAETYDKESKQRFSLEEKVKELAILNQQISKEAHNLTQALKGSVKQQGNWGEMILESILQNSGLLKGREYRVQEFIRDDAGNTIKDETGKKLQPDIIIDLPDNRQIIIDSKVSLLAYEKYTSSDDKQIQQLALIEHLKSIKSHIEQLSSKKYQEFVHSLDFVMMFIPIEPAYLIAMQEDATLWEFAYKKRILLISPTNLIAALKLVADLWQREQQNRNAVLIANRGAKLYDKFVNFVESLEDIGKNISKSQKSYENALKQLTEGSGNLIGQVEKLKKLGLSTQKSLANDYHNETIGDEDD